MRKPILILCITLLFKVGYAQLSFTTFYTKDGKETKKQEEAHYFRELALLENSQVQVIEKYINTNKTKLLGTYPSFNDKKFVGQKLEAFENGKIKSKELYSDDGVLIDTAYYYHPNGKIKIAFEYPYNFDGKSTKVTDTLILVYHDSLGNRHLANGNGYAELDYRNETIEKGRFENHKKVGTWNGTFMRGKYTFEESYQNGNLIAGITKDSLNKEFPYDSNNFMIPPQYPGDIQAIRQFIANHYKYPTQALQNKVKGTVKVSFFVEKDGKMNDYKIVEDIGYGTGDAAISVLKRAKNWKPGIMRGVPVRVAYHLPIRLDLTGR